MRKRHLPRLVQAIIPSLLLAAFRVAPAQQPPTELTNWQLQDAAKVPQPAETLSTARFHPTGWLAATVPGTVLTSLVHNGVYPEPLYGEAMRSIPESLNKTDYWYRTEFTAPRTQKGGHTWLHFAGVNYAAETWVNGHGAGTLRGAFLRGDFDISPFVKPGARTVLAVRVHPQPHPGIPHEHTVALGIGKNGGETAVDGPTFLSTIGWDWLMAIRDRDTGIWLPVTLSTTGPATLRDPFVVSKLSPANDHADLAITTTLSNHTASPVTGTLTGTISGQPQAITFSQPVTVPAGQDLTVHLDPTTTPALAIDHPLLWWPNGYGPQNLSHLQLTFSEHNHVSDQQTAQFGIRRIEYQVSDSENLTLSVNGVRVMVRGGNWGLDEAMKRIPRARLEAQFRMHALANLNLIRNWVGQSTSPDFYDLADKYGLLLWDEFFQPNPSDGPNPDDIPTYLANVTDKVKRYRNHPAIAVWCARNEGYPPRQLDDTLKALMGTLDPTRLYQSNSADGRGVSSHGPYYWRSPRFFYAFNESFKTETGSVSVPTIESIQGMMPQKDWETINDDWAQHDMAAGAQRGNEYPATLAHRYGHIRNLADFVRKAQLANYEAFRAMYESRNSEMFRTTTGVITWMSHPAQPSFVWQLYHYDLEPNSSLYATQKAAEHLHIQLNESNGAIEVVNNSPATLSGLQAHVSIYDAASHISSEKTYPVSVPGSTTVKAAQIVVNARISPLYFVKLDLADASGKPLSTNFYWQNVAEDDFAGLQSLPSVNVTVSVTKAERTAAAEADTTARPNENSHSNTPPQPRSTTVLTLTVRNTSPSIALLTHLQLRRRSTGDRVLPAFFSDNYLSLVPGEQRTLTAEVNTADLHGDDPLITVDGFNVTTVPTSGPVAVGPNPNADPAHWPATNIVPDPTPVTAAAPTATAATDNTRKGPASLSAPAAQQAVISTRRPKTAAKSPVSPGALLHAASTTRSAVIPLQ